uniref:Uncharacterized protein LOC114346540 n=1 Tax=Diabrotica virgifera virgifera TaxID=50390 RepID=A0A6P7HB65_DIAVI
MSRRLQVSRLSQDELDYELLIRGIAVGTVEQMRHALASAIRLEGSGDSVKYPDYPFTPEEDIQAVRGKLAELELLVNAFQGNKTSNDFIKYTVKLNHVINRIDNIPDIEEDPPQLVASAYALMGSLTEKAENMQAKSTVPVQVSCFSSDQTQNFATEITQASSPVAASASP